MDGKAWMELRKTVKLPHKKKPNKHKVVVKLIEKTWDSLESHLDACYEDFKVPRKMKSRYGSKRFHRDCVKEYAEMIHMLSTLL
jgi:hypothetical protein